MILEGSRYENAPVYRVTDSSGNTRFVVYPLTFGGTFQYTPHIWRDGDRLDILAYRYLDDAELWWMIAAANPELMPPEIPVGTRLRIPNV